MSTPDTSPYTQLTHLLPLREPSQSFRKAMHYKGIDFRDPLIADGKLHRFAPKGKGNKDGWYVFYGFSGAFGDWSQGIHELWSLKRNGSAPPHLEDLQTQIQQAHQQAEEERTRKQIDVAGEAASHWESLSETGTSPYLERKKVEAFGVRFEGEVVVVPLRDGSGKLWSYQSLYTDGSKRFLGHGRKKGCFHLIGTFQKDKPLYVVEGYATGASVHQATGHPVAVAFDAGNLDSVMGSLKEAYPHTSLTIAGDDDRWKLSNIGRIKAEEVAQKYGCSALFPTFKNIDTEPTDFNDLYVLEGVEEVKKQLSTIEAPLLWPEPAPLHTLKQSPLPVPSFSAPLIPEPYQDWLCDIAERMQCPLDYVAVGALIVTSSLIGAGCGIRPKAKDSWTIIPNLWGGIVGPPSTLKSPALKEILKPVEGLEKQAYETYKAAYQSYLIDLEAHKVLQDAIRKDMSKAASRSDSLALQEAKERLRSLKAPEEPVCKRYITNDTTIEKMHELLSKNPRGLLLFRDELMGLLTQWNKQGHESDRAFYLEAWNGYGAKTIDRIGRGTLYAENLCLSLLGTTQPLRLTNYFEKMVSGIENDGLFQRFQLLIYPDFPQAWKLVDKEPNEKAKTQASEVMHTLAHMDFTQYGAVPLSGGPPYFQFEAEAQKLFYEWLMDLETKLLSHEEDSVLIEHLAKYRKLMPSLALLFHLINLASGKPLGPITLDSVERAAGWCDYLEAHTRRIYALGLNTSWQAVRNLARKIQEKEIGSPFDIRDIYRKQWSFLKDRDEVRVACYLLEQKGWIRENHLHKEGKLKTNYLINPQIHQKGA